jgi:hypothetical protein
MQPNIPRRLFVSGSLGFLKHKTGNLFGRVNKSEGQRVWISILHQQPLSHFDKEIGRFLLWLCFSCTSIGGAHRMAETRFIIAISSRKRKLIGINGVANGTPHGAVTECEPPALNT